MIGGIQSNSLWRTFGRLWVVVLAGPVAILFAGSMSLPGVQLAVIGILVCASVGLAWETLRRLPRDVGDNPFLETPVHLSHDTEVFEHYNQIARAMLDISRHRDPIYRTVALEQLADISSQVTAVAARTIVFEGTETWRTVYGKLLRSPGVHIYRSVAWVKNHNYWQDEPGRKSMAVIFELHDAGLLNIERIAVIADEIWPQDQVWPASPIGPWLHEHHARGITIRMLRESAVKREPDLLADMGIYGSRALGIQELDERCQTVRFTLTFDFEAVLAAEARWDRLTVYATEYGAYLDQLDLCE